MNLILWLRVVVAFGAITCSATHVFAQNAPEAVVQSVEKLVQQGKTAEAASLVAALRTSYPDDATLKALSDELAKTKSPATPVQTSKSEAKTETSAVPTGPTGLDRVKWAGVEEIYDDAVAAKQPEEQRRLLASLLEKSAPLRAGYPEFLRLWHLRALAALATGDFDAGAEAGQRLLKLGAINTNDSGLLALLGRLDNEGYLAPPPVIDRTVPGGLSRREMDLPLAKGVNFRAVWIEPGVYTRGSTNGNKDEAPHSVTLTRGFWLGKFEVTQAQWQAVMATNPSRFLGPDRPVENVSWDDVQTFLQRANTNVTGLPDGYAYALPTEAQWEYACRAGTTGDYAGPLDELGWYGAGANGGQQTTQPVGGKRANAWGLHDMHGNVNEWCSDWYGSYPIGRIVDPIGPQSGTDRVCRGGNWRGSAFVCRSAVRVPFGPSERASFRGSRLALSSVR